MAAFCEELLSENDFETVFATSVLMTNMVPLLRQFKRSLYTDQKDEWMSWMLIVCYSLLNSQNISINNSWLCTY